MNMARICSSTSLVSVIDSLSWAGANVMATATAAAVLVWLAAPCTGTGEVVGSKVDQMVSTGGEAGRKRPHL